jgi:hypothetical protein
MVYLFITDSKIHVKPEPANPEASLREMWTRQGVSEEQQNKLIASAAAKAQPGTQVGPWTMV